MSATASAPAVTTTFDYDDSTGRLASREDVIDGKTFTVLLTYDTRDHLETIAYPSGRQVGYAFDTHNRLSRVYDASTDADYATNFQYDGAGMLRSYTAGNGVVTTLGYDDNTRRLSDIDAGTLLDLAYLYDAVGNVEEIADGRGSTFQQTFTFDPLDRLETAQTGTSLYGYLPFDYDVHGNIQASGGLSFAYESSNPFRLTHIGGLGHYQYSPSGNLIAQDGPPSATYTYTADNLLDATTQSGVTTRYVYDGQGARIRKLIENGPTFYYTRGPGGQLLSQWLNTSGSTATARDYLYAGSLLLGVITKTDLPPK